MPQLPQNAFTFVSRGLPEDTFSVVRFSGEEGLSTLYKFEILLVSEQEDVDLEHLLQNPATLTIKGQFSGGMDLPFHGILTSFEQMHQVGQYVFYRAELRPKAWWLTLTRHNQVFLEMTSDKFVEAVLMDAGLHKGEDFEIRLTQKFPPHEYVCQYMEFHFDFVSRWAEYGGAYYWFEQGRDTEKMICTDSKIAHMPLPGFETCTYSPPSGLDAAAAGQVIKAFTLKQRPMPRKVMLRDYNYMRPGLEMRAQSDVLQDKGFGEIYLWAERFRTQATGEYLARIRAELFKCMEKIFRGVSTIPAIRPGYLFTLAKHYRQDFNGQYLTTTVRHEGSQERYLVGGLGVRGVKDKEALFYRNTFECIPGKTQFRPMIKAQKPVAPGNIVAKIDAAGSGQYAELDEHGRYKVILPFDLSGREGGKASCWLRMMTPYAGEGHGMHFPLLKGAEVMIGFEQGDVDRPFIAGAVHNPDKPNLVTDKNVSVNAIRTSGGNTLVMSDEQGKEYVGLYSPFHESGISLGSVLKGGGGSISMSTKGDYDTLTLGDRNSVVVGTQNSALGGFKNDITLGVSNTVFGGTATSFTTGTDVSMFKGWKISLGTDATSITTENALAGLKKLTLTGGHAPTFSEPLKLAIANLLVSALGGALGAAGTSLLAEGHDDDGALKGEGCWPDALGGSFLGLGALLSAIGAIQTKQLVDQFNKAQKQAARGTVILDQNGVSIDSPVKIVIKIIDYLGDEKTSLVLHPNGMAIESSELKEKVRKRKAEIENEERVINKLNIEVDKRKVKYGEDNVWIKTLKETITTKQTKVDKLKLDAQQIQEKASAGFTIDGGKINIG
jgi:type VI secretion system VgrG family protein